MLDRLRRFLSWDSAMLADLTRRVAQVEEKLYARDKQLRELEAERVELLAEWSKVRDQVVRGMKRLGALSRKAGTAEDTPESPNGDDPEWEATQELAARLKLMRGY